MPELRTYADAAAFLNGLINYERLLGSGFRYNTKTFDLEHFRGALVAIGNPHLRYPVIHVAGTKGKGSTSAFLHYVFRAAGLKTGLYTSPHIDSYCERIALNGTSIPEAEFCRILTRLSAVPDLEAHESHGNFRTVFEFLTATAFTYFAEQGVDVAVIETGLGGRLDSTNVFDGEGFGDGWLIDVVTTIGLDHTHILGDTIEAICREKAGIIRRHAKAVVMASQKPSWADTVQSAIEQHAASVDAPAVTRASVSVDCELVETRSNDHGVPGMTAMFCTKRDDHTPLCNALRAGLQIASPLAGMHQLENIRTVLTVLLEIVSRTSMNIPPDTVRSGIESTRWPGRFQIVQRRPLVVVDGAHCALSAAALAETFSSLFENKPVTLVAGFMRDKAAIEMCRALKGKMNVIDAVCCAPPTPRALPAEQAAKALRDALGVHVEIVPDPRNALVAALGEASMTSAVVVFGSMYLVGPAIAYFQDAPGQTG